MAVEQQFPIPSSQYTMSKQTSGPYILIVGDVMLDRYWFGEVNRISPEAPVPVVLINRNEERLGGAANVARNVAALGADCSLMGIVGDDEAGMIVESLLNEADIVPLACEGLMEYVEQGISDKEGLKAYLENTLGPYLTDNTESIVLGCTHYPFIIKEIREYLGDRNIVLIDGSKGTSSQLKRKLEEKDLMRDGNHCGAVTILNSSDDPEMIELSERLLGQNDPEVQND